MNTTEEESAIRSIVSSGIGGNQVENYWKNSILGKLQEMIVQPVNVSFSVDSNSSVTSLNNIIKPRSSSLNFIHLAQNYTKNQSSFLSYLF